MTKFDVVARGHSDVGQVRDHNEDRYFCDAERGVFVVADGIGGKSGGEVASQMVVDAVAGRADEFRDFIDARTPMVDEEHRDEIFDFLFGHLQGINKEVFQRGRSTKYPRGIGCTVDMVVFAEGGAFILHVGDSRVYLVRDDEIYRVTRDHTYAEKLRRQPELQSDDIDPDDYSHVLTRSIGGAPRVNIDRLFIGVGSQSRFILCTDGITGYFSGAEILDFSRRHDDELPRQLVEEANQRGGKDNSTVVVATVGGEEGKPFSRKQTEHDTFGRARFLQSIELFSDLGLQELLKVLRYVRGVRCATGGKMITRGDAVDGLYFVMSGELSVEVDGRELDRLGPGEHFGEIGMFGQPIRSADVCCRNACEILFMPRENLHRLVREEPELGNKLLWRLLNRTSQIVQEMLSED